MPWWITRQAWLTTQDQLEVDISGIIARINRITQSQGTLKSVIAETRPKPSQSLRMHFATAEHKIWPITQPPLHKMHRTYDWTLLSIGTGHSYYQTKASSMSVGKSRCKRGLHIRLSFLQLASKSTGLN